jgi:two-component system response regulator
MSKLLLLVEDNPTDEKLTVRAFEKCGVDSEIVVARDGAEALDYLFGTGPGLAREVPVSPAVVLLDLKLPRVDGLEVLRRIRADARTRLLPVVILTASKEDEDVIRGHTLGVNAYVRKPADLGELTKAAETLGRFWLLINEDVPRSPGPR